MATPSAPGGPQDASSPVAQAALFDLLEIPSQNSTPSRKGTRKTAVAAPAPASSGEGSAHRHGTRRATRAANEVARTGATMSLLDAFASAVGGCAAPRPLQCSRPAPEAAGTQPTAAPHCCHRRHATGVVYDERMLSHVPPVDEIPQNDVELPRRLTAILTRLHTEARLII